MQRLGNVLVDRHIHQLAGGSQPRIICDPQDVRPCSLDLRIGTNIWQVSGVPSLAGGFCARRFLAASLYNDFRPMAPDLTITPGSIYLAELTVEFDLPGSVWGFTNPKSSAGRIDLMCTVIAEGGREFNTIPPGYRGRLYMLMIPQSFPVKDLCGQDLVQMRFYDGPRRILQGHELQMLHGQYALVEGVEPMLADDGIILRLDLHSFNPGNLVATGSGRPISLVARDIDPEHYFLARKYDSDGRMFLKPGEFFLAPTVERVRIPAHISGEMVPFREQQGEFRSHYAGFFDPGFGYGAAGEAASATAVCEIRNVSTATIIFSHGQPVALLRYEYVWEPPVEQYGAAAAKGSNYQSQTGVKLAKFFRPWPSPELQPAQAR